MTTPPDLVIFDVDGTLHDAFAWWAPVLRRGLAAFAAREGLVVELPDDAAADAVVGSKDAGVWAPFLPASQRDRWRELRAVVLPMELDELRAGRDYLFPGVRELLVELRRQGVGTALASNCHQLYMDAIREGQGLAALTGAQFCLDSPGVTTKTDMIRLAVGAAGARRAWMVGDREPDLEAAREAGLPFVWRANARCDLSAAADLVWAGGAEEFLHLAGLARIS